MSKTDFSRRHFVLYRFGPPLALLLSIPLLYPALFLAFGKAVPFGGHADLQYILGTITHLLKTDWVHLFELPVYQPLSGMLSAAHPLLFGLFPFFKLFQLLGFDLPQSHTLYLICALYLHALGHFLLLRILHVSRAIAFVLALFTILWGLNVVHFIWLTFLSLFWLPFTLCCLISWYKKPRWLTGVGAALCSGMLFAANEYYGVFFVVFLLPPLMIMAFYKKREQKKLWLSLLVPLILVGLLILFLYAPLLKNGLHVSGVQEFDASQLIDANDLFCYSHPLASLFPGASFFGHSLYLGLGFAILLLSFFAAPFRRFGWIWSGLVALFVAATISFFISSLWLLIFTYCLLLAISLLFLKGRTDYDLWGRLSVWLCGAFLLLLWGMPQFDSQGYLSLFRLVWKYIPVFGGLRAFERVFPLLLPFLLIIAARGMQRLFEKGIKKTVLVFVFGIALILMMAEHVYQNQFTHLVPLPLRPGVYGAIAKDERGTVLALPLYLGFVRLEDNARYMANQGYHGLTMLGGISSQTPPNYLPRLQALVDHGRLDSKNLRRLIESHALSHLVIHWDWMAEIYGGADSEHLIDLRARLERLKDWLRPIYEDENASLYEVMDPEENTVFMRTFSRGQLLGNMLQVRIISGGGDNLTWSVDGQVTFQKVTIGPERVVRIIPSQLPLEEPVVLCIRMDQTARLEIKAITIPDK